MKCHEARKLIGPYLDSELDAKTSYDIVQHLESCAACARVFEAEEKLDARIFSVLRQGQKTAALWEKLEGKVAGHDWWSRLWQMKPLTRLALGSGLVGSIILLGVVLWSSTRVPDLAAAVEQDHQEFLDRKFGPEFAGALPETVARRLDDRLDAGAFAQLPSAPGFQAKGSRLCFLRGVPAAWTLGQYANALVSVVVLKQTELEHFPQIAFRRTFCPPSRLPPCKCSPFIRVCRPMSWKGTLPRGWSVGLARPMASHARSPNPWWA